MSTENRHGDDDDECEDGDDNDDGQDIVNVTEEDEEDNCDNYSDKYEMIDINANQVVDNYDDDYDGNYEYDYHNGNNRHDTSYGGAIITMFEVLMIKS